jgi:hypothetical protein
MPVGPAAWSCSCGAVVEREKERKVREPGEDRRQVLARSLVAVALPWAGVALPMPYWTKKALRSTTKKAQKIDVGTWVCPKCTPITHCAAFRISPQSLWFYIEMFNKVPVFFRRIKTIALVGWLSESSS